MNAVATKPGDKASKRATVAAAANQNAAPAPTRSPRKDELLRDLLDQAKVMTSLLFDIYSGESSITAPAESSMVVTMIQLLTELLISADERAEAISLMSDERDPIRQVRGLGEYLCAEATTKWPDHEPGLRFGDRFASLCFWTVERRIDRAIEILTDGGGAA